MNLEEYKKKKEELTSYGKELIKKETQLFFEQAPGVVLGITWNQYIPSFNDGEPCKFMANEVKVLIEEEDGDVTFREKDCFAFDAWDIEGDSGDTLKEAQRQALAVLMKAFDEIKDELNTELETVFGSNVTVTLDRNLEVTTEEYDCEY